MAPTVRRVAVGLSMLAVVVVVAACQSTARESSPRPTPAAESTTTSTAPVSSRVTEPVSSTTTNVRPNLAAVSIRARRIYPFVEPTSAIGRPGDDRLWITERAGYVSVVDGANAFRLLDLSGEVSTNGERGLLGIAFSLDGQRLYLSFTDRTVANRVVEYEMAGASPNVKTRREVIGQPHPFNAHHGGGLATGPDGMLYIGWGDGESPAKRRKENAQSLESLLGKILRIDPRASNSRPYAIPPGNPFVGRAGARPEIFALGLRNPWRFTFDRRNGDLWIGDVGQYRVEEIARVRAGQAAGANFGWPFLEGTTPRQGTAPAGLTAPLLTYDHDDRCAVIGGYVYRGSALPKLRGSYIYGDLCDNHVRALRVEGDRIVQQKDFGALVPEGLAGFGEDAEGELYLLSLPSGVFKLE